MLNMFEAYALDDGWYNPLIAAINKADIKEINRWCKCKDVDVNKRFPNGGKTALHVAAEIGNKNVILALIANGANVKIVTDRSFTALHVAAQNGHTDILQILIEAGINVSSVTDVGTTPLHEAAANGHQAATSKLLELNADRNIKEFRFNLTAYDLANIKKHIEIRNIILPNYQKLFTQDITKILSNSIETFPMHVVPNENKFIEKLRLSIKSATTSDEAFKVLQTHLLGDDYKKVSALLQPMKKALIELMKKYNEDKLCASKNASATSSTAIAKKAPGKK